MLSALQELCPLPPRYVFAGGDWNLTEFLSDSNNGDHFASSLTVSGTSNFMRSTNLSIPVSNRTKRHGWIGSIPHILSQIGL